MQQLRRNSVSRVLSYLMIAALLAPQCLIGTPAFSAEAGANVPAVAVIPFQDITGRTNQALMREVTASAALALEDSKQFVVTSTTDLDREMQSLNLQPPLSVAQQIRLGDRLHVEKVLIGNLADLSVDSRTGRAHVVLRVMMLDVNVGEYLDGAISDITTRAIAGFSGDVAAVTHEALREAAEDAVNKMLTTSVRRGTVEMVDDQGNVNINLGTNDGLVVGSDLLVLRPTWQPDVEKVIMRRIGVIRIADIEADMSVARSVEGSVPTTGDRIYRVYKPVSVMQAEARSRNIKSKGQTLAALLLLLGLATVASGPTTATPSGLQAQLAQTAPGDTPVIKLQIFNGSTGRDKTHGMLIFRAGNNPDFPATADFLVDAIDGLISSYSDNPFDVRSVDSFEIAFKFIDTTSGTATETDGTVTVSYNRGALVAGNRYYYRVRRIMEPLAPPGANPPIASAQAVTPSIETSPDNRVLSDPSNPAGPVTFFLPPVQISPTNAASSLTTSNIQFTWQTSTGANEYIVEVFPSTDPDGRQAPILQSAPQRSTGSGLLTATISGPFSATTTYYWRVGARQTADPRMPLNLATGKTGWLYSSMFAFTTANTPPAPPSTTDVKPGHQAPTQHGGWWGGRRGQ